MFTFICAFLITKKKTYFRSKTHIKIDQNQLKSIKIDQNRSKSIEIDQNRFKNGKNDQKI